jgi:hypothetical protein
VSLTRWSNKARSFCRHLARVNASEPHTRSMMYPIPGSARSTTEVRDVCFQNMNTFFWSYKIGIIRASVLWQFGTVSLARSAPISCATETVTGPLRPAHLVGAHPRG